MATWLHDQRFTAVMQTLRAAGAASVLDLGCGAGAFLIPLAAHPAIQRVTGVEPARPALDRLRADLAMAAPATAAKVTLVQGSALAWVPQMSGHDAVVLIEVIEHLDPSQLSVLETVLFRRIVPPLVVLTTPNADFNPLLGVPAGRMRHAGHRFEWGRARFRTWAAGVAARCGYAARCQDIGGAHPDLGAASQMAVFSRRA